MLLAALSAGEIAAIVIAAVPVIGLLIAAANVLVSVVNERRRTQPIVICHETHQRHAEEGSALQGWALGAYIQNEGASPAFNVRFGVDLDGIRFPYKFQSNDPDAGNVQRVVSAGQHVPKGGAFEIFIDSTLLRSGKGELNAGRVYWARYENAQGKTWETRNPGDRSARLDIRRVRWLGRVERQEEEAREQVRREGVERENTD